MSSMRTDDDWLKQDKYRHRGELADMIDFFFSLTIACMVRGCIYVSRPVEAPKEAGSLQGNLNKLEIQNLVKRDYKKQRQQQQIPKKKKKKKKNLR